jgi:methylmalonyl-CoA/ethylmalonyl-CoA epimerase
VHHIGIACRDLMAVRDWVHDIFSVTLDSGVVHDPLQDADLCLLSIENDFALELVSGRVVEGMLRRRSSYYHLCYEVDEITETISSLQTGGCRLISGPVPAVLFGGRPVAFLLSPLGLLELLGAR